jgi:flagellar motor switch protein FliM
MQSVEEESIAEKPKEPQQKYRKYDFYSPKKYTKDKLKMLRSIYDNYCRIATSQINGLFRVASEVEVVGVEEQRYYEFGNALNESDVISLVRVNLSDHSKNPPMLFHIAPTLMGAMIDRMLGGTGTDTSVDMSYTYTDIELALYERIIQYLVAITPDVWSSYIKLKTEFERVEENPSMFQGISVDETVVIVMINISIGDVKGAMNICIPGTLLGNIFDIIEKTKHLADKGGVEDTTDSRDEILGSIKESKIDVMAQLGVMQLNLDDVYNLHVGDVI